MSGQPHEGAPSRDAAPSKVEVEPHGVALGQEAEPVDDGSGAALEWVSWPVRDDYPRSLGLCAIEVCTALGIGATTHSVGWGLLSLLVLALATLRYFVRTRVRLDPNGVELRACGRSQRRGWDRVRNVYYHRDGAFLSPFCRPSRLDSFRGIFLRYAGNRAEVEAFLRARPQG